MTIRIRLNKPENALYYNKLVGSIIVMEFEDYVFGVVAAEIGNARMAACQAQAVAARTKALPYIHRGQPISDSSDTAQSFRATRMDAAKYPNAKAATDATAGEVLMYGKYVLDTCAYSANNGGRTTSSEARWGGYRAYLIEQNDPWDYAATGGKKTGHGVGMSQAGTKWAAAQGIGYADILAFYYPGAYLAPAYTKEGMYGMTNHEQVNEFEKMVGWAYVWGSAKAGAVDCSGAFVYAMKKYGLSIFHGSNTIWRNYQTQKGKIGQIEQQPGMAMFKWRSTGEPDKFKGDGIGDFFHIGCYAGNGRVIEAKGTKYGVVISSIDSWTHAGRVKGIQYDTSGAGSTTTQGGLTMEVFARVTTTSGKLNLRAQPDAAAVVLAKIPQDEVVKVLDQADGAWWKVSYGGTTGYAMAEFLTVGGGDGSGVRVVIPCAGREDAERLLELFKGAYVEE